MEDYETICKVQSPPFLEIKKVSRIKNLVPRLLRSTSISATFLYTAETLKIPFLDRTLVSISYSHSE